MYRLFLISIFLFGIGHAIAQDFQKDIEAMANGMADSESLKLIFKVDTYRTENDSKPVDTNYAQVERQGNNYFYNLGDLTVLVNDRSMIVINKELNSMVYSPIQKGNGVMDLGEINMGMNPEDIKNKISNNKFIGVTDNGWKHYIVSVEGDANNECELFLEASSNQLKKVIYKLDPSIYTSSMVIINYDEFETNPSFDSDHFSELNFVCFDDDGQATPLPKFENYDFVINKYSINE